jgi:hypothetical protein
LSLRSISFKFCNEWFSRATEREEKGEGRERETEEIVREEESGRVRRRRGGEEGPARRYSTAEGVKLLPRSLRD